MKIVSLNIGQKTRVIWKNEEIETGIFKTPVSTSIYLDKHDVKNDAVVERRYHGGVDKACYFFGENNYEQFKQRYSELDWKHGMFGENITLQNVDEKTLKIGDIAKIGEAIVQVSEPREPCFKLGIRFGSQKVLKDFIQFRNCGFYVRVLQPGAVNKQDQFIIIEKAKADLTVAELFEYAILKSNPKTLVKIQASTYLSAKYKSKFNK